MNHKRYVYFSIFIFGTLSIAFATKKPTLTNLGDGHNKERAQIVKQDNKDESGLIDIRIKNNQDKNAQETIIILNTGKDEDHDEQMIDVIKANGETLKKKKPSKKKTTKKVAKATERAKIDMTLDVSFNADFNKETNQGGEITETTDKELDDQSNDVVEAKRRPKPRKTTTKKRRTTRKLPSIESLSIPSIETESTESSSKQPKGNIIIDVDGEDKGEEEEEDGEKEENTGKEEEEYGEQGNDPGECWMKLNTAQHFKVMDALDAEYENTRRSYQESADSDHFDEKMLNAMLQSRGVADRNLNKENFIPTTIPAGLSLGAKLMFRMRASVLFFHRLKLRNETRFRIEYLHHDLMSMTLVARLVLHDLHLTGSYERALADRDPSLLYYAPSYGSVEFLLKDVKFKVEGRYRLLKDRLTIELIASDIIISELVMSYIGNTSPENKDMELHKDNIADFAARVKNDLNSWLKDYFNDYLMGFSLEGPIEELQKYDKKRLLALNEFADSAISEFKKKLLQINGTAVSIPSFTILSVVGMEIKLREGVIRGLHTMYRRSVATGKQEKDIRKVDAVVAFSHLKVVYKYEVSTLTSDLPPLDGYLYLTSDELTAHMALTLPNNSNSFDVSFDYLENVGSESLIVEGSANTLIANFKHILGHHIIAIMVNALTINVKLLGTLPKCEPDFNIPQNEPIKDEETDGDNYSGSSDQGNDLGQAAESSEDDQFLASDKKFKQGNLEVDSRKRRVKPKTKMTKKKTQITPKKNV